MRQMIPAHVCYRSLKYLASEIHLKPTMDKFSFNTRSLFHRAYVNVRVCVCVCESTYFYPKTLAEVSTNRQRECAAWEGCVGLRGTVATEDKRAAVARVDTYCSERWQWQSQIGFTFQAACASSAYANFPLTLFRCPSRPAAFLTFYNFILRNRNQLLFFFYRHSIEDKHCI